MATPRRHHLSSAATSAVETASWYVAMCVVVLVLVSALRESVAPAVADAEAAFSAAAEHFRAAAL
ncbi:hypothetical protein HPP92_026163 [Vanilla planifolia]|uniref:Uncharacterized protein n=1 Tax=Vanilla planifolia TaxID=51239 RepID=A0A835U8B2_VANPL|nr:hypothetical protein HPP92_026163 [Vanilla planifolia]